MKDNKPKFLHSQHLTLRINALRSRKSTLNPSLDAALMANMKHLLPLLVAPLPDDAWLLLIDTSLFLCKFSREFKQEKALRVAKQALVVSILSRIEQSEGSATDS